MNRPSIVVCVMVVALVAAFILYQVPSRSNAAMVQERDAREPAGDRFEYFSITHTAWHNQFEFASPERRGEKLSLEDLARALELRRRTGEERDLDMTDVLNHLGGQGWELVAFNGWSYADGGAEKRWYLKRQKR